MTDLDPVLQNIITAYHNISAGGTQDIRLRAHLGLFDACKALADRVDLGTHYHPCDLNHDTRPAGQANDIYAQPTADCFTLKDYCLHHGRPSAECAAK